MVEVFSYVAVLALMGYAMAMMVGGAQGAHHQYARWLLRLFRRSLRWLVRSLFRAVRLFFRQMRRQVPVALRRIRSGIAWIGSASGAFATAHPFVAGAVLLALIALVVWGAIG